MRMAPLQGSVELGADHIDVHAGALSQRIRAADVRAASTARTAQGVALALVRDEPRSRPIVLEVSDDRELDALRRSLKLGHYGFGELAWPTRRPGGPIRSSVLAILTGGWATMALAAACGSAVVCLSVALWVVPISILVAIDRLFGGGATGHVSLTEHSVGVNESTGSWSAAYRDIVRVESESDRLTVWTSRSTAGLVVPTRGMEPCEREHLRAQIECAAQRAQGRGQPPPEVPAPVTLLAPRGEGTRAWLERLDAAAASLVERGGAYRQADLSTHDLWAALESPDAPAPLRVAAARVLARVVPDEATRIGVVLAGERDVDTRARIHVALEEDVDVAAQELDRLDLVSRVRDS
jgi:hypothetical protein